MTESYRSQTARIGSGAPHVTDKKPDNFKRVGMIKLMFPNAVVIHTHRDPIDKCLSLFKNHFSDNGPFYGYDQTELTHYYPSYTRLMAHWHTVLPGFVHNVRYKSLVSDPDSGTKELLDYCGLDF